MKRAEELESVRTHRLADRVAVIVLAVLVAIGWWVVTPPAAGDGAAVVAWTAPENTNDQEARQ